MTIEELLAALRELVAAAEAEDRELTEEEVDRATDLEKQIDVIQRSQNIRARTAALGTTDTTHLRGVVSGTPDGTGAGVLYGAERTGMSAADKETLERAFDTYMRTGIAVPEMAHYRAQGTGTGAAGGFLVPEEFRQKLIERVVSFGGVAEEAESYTTSTGAPVVFPTIDDTANTGEIVAEHAAPAGGADLAFGEKEIGSYTYQAPGAGANPLRVSVELAQDSAFNIQDLVQRLLSRRIARAQAEHWVNGTGTGQPEGITASTGPSHTFTGAAITYAALVAAKYTIDKEYRAGAKWFFADSTMAALESMTDTTGRPLLQPAAASGLAGDNGMTLLNHPVVIDNAFADYTDASSNNWGAFGNMREAYVIRHVQSVEMIVNPYSRANNREIEYTLWARGDGMVQNPYAVSILKNDAV